MKTLKIALGNSSVTHDYACGLCFYLVDSEDRFCKDCGIEFDDDCASSYEGLKQFMDEQTKESNS